MFTTHEFSEKSLAGWARNPFQGAVLILSCNSAPELSPIALSQNPMAALVKDGMHRSRLLYKFSTNIRDAHRLNGGKRHLCGDSVCLGWQRSRIDVTWPLTSPCTCASVLRRLSDPRPRRIHLRPRSARWNALSYARPANPRGKPCDRTGFPLDFRSLLGSVNFLPTIVTLTPERLIQGFLVDGPSYPRI